MFEVYFTKILTGNHYSKERATLMKLIPAK